MNQEKKMLLDQIHEHILEKYRLADVPMIFQTMNCASDECRPADRFGLWWLFIDKDGCSSFSQ